MIVLRVGSFLVCLVASVGCASAVVVQRPIKRAAIPVERLAGEQVRVSILTPENGASALSPVENFRVADGYVEWVERSSGRREIRLDAIERLKIDSPSGRYSAWGALIGATLGAGLTAGVAAAAVSPPDTGLGGLAVPFAALGGAAGGALFFGAVGALIGGSLAPVDVQIDVESEEAALELDDADL